MKSEKSIEQLAVYVDGFNLYHGLHDASGTELLWLDLVKLARNLRPRSSVLKVKYFTAMVTDDPDAQSRQDRYISALKALYPGRVTVIHGQYMSKKRTCRECGAIWKIFEEKQTDVNIAVHLVADVAAKIADTFMVISADSDVIPAIKMGRTLNQHATIIAQFPPRRESKALRRLLPSSRQITLQTIRESQLDDLTVSTKGEQFMRPTKWTSVANTKPSINSTCEHPDSFETI